MNGKVSDRAGLLVGTGLAALGLWYWTRNLASLPPGPSGNLIFGSALELRNSNAFWIDFAKYSDQYGPLITVRMMFRRVIVITDPKLITELFEKRAVQYSDRTINAMGKLVGWEDEVLFLEYGPKLKHYRTLLQRALNNRVALDYLPLQENEVKRMMRRICETPENFMQHIHLMAGSVAIRMAYGYKVESHEDQFIQSQEKIMSIFADVSVPGRWMVNNFPPLRYLPSWLPGMEFRRTAASWAAMVESTRNEPFDFVKRQLADGKAETSFVAKLLRSETGEATPEDEVHIKTAAASIYAAASDTTVSIIQSFFLAMVLYPECQAKAKAEITNYLQGETQSSPSAHQSYDGLRFITMADRQHLPYTNALIRELLRWHPVVPLVGHSTYGKDDHDVVFDGRKYTIPAHTPVIANVWKLMHDPEVYSQPDRFIPERFLAENPPPGPELYAFGFGRRICPGTHVAQQSMWLSISNLLAAFNISKAKDESGREITPEERYTNGAISHPVPFRCSIVPEEGYNSWLFRIED